MLKTEINCSLSGSTLVSVLIIEEILWCANLGDSRAILIKNEANLWKVLPLSIDHKVDLEIEAKRILDNGGRIEQGKAKLHF